MAAVTIFTQVYNTAPYIRQCVESVLEQSFSHFEYVLIDNGCTDGCKEILKEYVEKDSRIKLLSFEENAPGRIWKAAESIGDSPYFSTLDSDDWLEKDYLETLMSFAEENHLDIACTGTMMHIMATGSKAMRKIDQPLILPRESFSYALPRYHVFFRTHWGKLIRFDLLRQIRPSTLPAIYGRDTLICFGCLRHAGRIGVDNSILHHYRIHKKSSSYQYNPKRFDADVYLYNDAIEFLTSFGPISAQNREFLQAVYSNAVTDTLGVIRNSGLSSVEKLREYRRIAEHPITRAAYRECTDESARRSKTLLLQSALGAGAALNGRDNEDFQIVLQQLLPRCGRVVTAGNLALFLKTPELLKALLRDDSDIILRDLLSRVEQSRDVKKYALTEMLQALAADRPLLCQINDTAFLKKYGGIYWEVWQEGLLGALDEMTGLLLKNQVRSGRETFLKLYISLSAQLEQAGAFIFGKLRLAELYFNQNRLAECRSLVEELEEMGLGEEDEVQALQSKLENGSFQT